MKYKVETKHGTYVFLKTISNQELQTFSCPAEELKVGDVIEVIEKNGLISSKINRIPATEKPIELDDYESTVVYIGENKIKFLSERNETHYATWDELEKYGISKNDLSVGDKIRVAMEGEGRERYRVWISIIERLPTKTMKLPMTDMKNEDHVIITPEDLRRYFCPQATETELYIAAGIMKTWGLNPFKQEVHLIKYREDTPLKVVVGYMWYIKQAEKTGKLKGWNVSVDSEGKSATCEIIRSDWNSPFKWTVDLAEFDKGNSMWKKMPRFMLKKVAIAQAFRMCFSENIGGAPYTVEEIEGEDSKKEDEVINDLKQKIVIV